LRRRQLPEAHGNVVVAHLGNGASLCAIQNGRSVDASTGFSRWKACPWARAGALDAGVLLYLLQQGMTPAALEDLLYHQSGLLGVSGVSADVRTLQQSNGVAAREALELFRLRCAGEAARLATPWAAWTRWSSPPASANTTRACVRPSAPPRLAWRAAWMRAPMPSISNASAPGQPLRVLVIRPMKSRSLPTMRQDLSKLPGAIHDDFLPATPAIPRKSQRPADPAASPVLAHDAGHRSISPGADVVDKHLRFLEEEAGCMPSIIRRWPPPTGRMALRTLSLREYGKAGAAHAVPTLVVAPYAGHTSVIADYYQGQSLVETLLEHGVPHVFLTDWHSASEDMKDLEIDNYLADLCVVIDELGGRANLVGLCQGG
jgi:hypothetical protein